MGLGEPHIVNIACLMDGTGLCQIYVKLKYNSKEQNGCELMTYYDVQSDVHNVNGKSKMILGYK